MSQQHFKDHNLVILIAFTFYATVYCTDATSPYESKDLYKLKLGPSRHFFEIFKQNHNLEPKTAHKNRTTVNSSATEASHVKKWQVGRVSRRQYEIINMLWRKTKEFGDVEISTMSIHPEYPLYRLPSRSYPTSTTSTPSFIEFYYLDENDDRTKNTDRKHQNLKNIGSFNNYYPVFAFHINNKYRERFVHKYANVNTKPPNKIDTAKQAIKSFLNSVTFQKLTHNVPYKRATQIPNTTEPLYTIDNETCLPTLQDLVTTDKEVARKYSQSYPSIIIHRNIPGDSTVYDKIKFFEMYDKHTPLPYYREDGNPIDFDDANKAVNRNVLNNDQRILLEHVDQGFGNEHSKRDKPSLAKKHIIENNKRLTEEITSKNLVTEPTKSFNVSTKKINQHINESFTSKSKLPSMHGNAINKIAQWSDYSYMAVYIYEPTQVHCDAAGISPHWLVTSGSCLSRHHKNPSGEGRSAFVAYCGISWWMAERIAYVKYSVVHPHYNQKDINRRYLYNIGLIQVVISLTTCPGWSPISLMSHRFVADPKHSTAYAIGWGLDRYNTQYSSADLPKYPLMAYESLVFSDSCPGSLSYSKAKHQAEDDAIQNLYCLSLPPYSGEDTDPIHGSMLVVGGNLCGIYLQEERRPSGEQSAEYTGTWQLGPWVSHVAREPDDTEPFTFVI